MATAPLFVATVEELKSKLRLASIPAGQGADILFDETLLAVRTHFYRALGPARVAELAALPFNENPATEDEILRAVANTTEVKWMRMELMRVLPTLFKDSSADQHQVYHDEALFRETPGDQLSIERERLWSDIQENLELLRGDEELDEEVQGISASTPESDSTAPRPGQSVWPSSAFSQNELE